MGKMKEEFTSGTGRGGGTVVLYNALCQHYTIRYGSVCKGHAQKMCVCVTCDFRYVRFYECPCHGRVII